MNIPSHPQEVLRIEPWLKGGNPSCVTRYRMGRKEKLRLSRLLTHGSGVKIKANPLQLSSGFFEVSQRGAKSLLPGMHNNIF